MACTHSVIQMANLRSCASKFQKINRKTFYRKTFFTQFCIIGCNVLSNSDKIFRWIKDDLPCAGFEISVFKSACQRSPSSRNVRDIEISVRDMLMGSSWKNVSLFKTFYPKDTISRDKNSNDLEYNFDTPLLSNSSIVQIIFITKKKFRKNLFNLYSILSQDLALMNREFQSMILTLMHSILLHLSIALNTLYKVYSLQES